MPVSEQLAILLAAFRATDPVEVAGVLTGVACVWLAARNSVWNFPVALLSCGLYLVVFGRAKLYSDASLQVVFMALAAYGWWQWARCGAAAPALPITGTSAGLWGKLAVAGLVYAVGAGYLFATRTDAALPYFDSSTTAVSLVAQYLLSRRKIENWLLWLGVDVGYVAMYWQRQLVLTSALYGVFLLLAAYGYWQWRREKHRQPLTPLAP